MRIGIVGSGVVGYATGSGLSKIGHSVIFFDVNSERVRWIRNNGLEATDDIRTLARSADVIFISVPTPTVDGKIDLSYVKSAIKNLGDAISSRKDYFTIVVKSSVIPTTTENVIVPQFERHSGKVAGKDFGVCMNPEFLQEKCANDDFMHPDRIVIGEYDKRSGDVLEEIYKFFSCPILRVDIRTAEIIKYANNCFYATKISFFNEIHLMCSKLGIDSEMVRKAVQLDRFYGTHPWSHGHAFGGKCLPKDLSAFIDLCESDVLGEPILLKSVRLVNEKIRALDETGSTSTSRKEELRVGLN
jgi:UDPglucose 6-dehydrogenase